MISWQYKSMILLHQYLLDLGVTIGIYLTFMLFLFYSSNQSTQSNCWILSDVLTSFTFSDSGVLMTESEQHYDLLQLLVYGAGKVIPTTLNTIQPNLTYSLMVSLTSSVQYGRVILVMDKSFCTDAAGNKFARSQNSWFFIHFGACNFLS